MASLVGKGIYDSMTSAQVKAARRYMRAVIGDHVDPVCCMVNATSLAEAAAYELGLESLLSDEANLWDIAVEEALRYEEIT